MSKLKESLKSCQIIKKGEYDYFVNPITDGIPEIDPGLLKEVVGEIKSVANTGYDKIITAEAMGIPLATSLSLDTGKPLSVIRKRKYGIEGEISVEQVTGYSTSEMYINGIKKGDKVLIVDDVVSTGGTLTAIVGALRSIGAEIIDIVIVINKNKNKADLEGKLDMKVKTLVNVNIVDGKMIVD